MLNLGILQTREEAPERERVHAQKPGDGVGEERNALSSVNQGVAQAQVNIIKGELFIIHLKSRGEAKKGGNHTHTFFLVQLSRFLFVLGCFHEPNSLLRVAPERIDGSLTLASVRA
jgi:hypothetical protein